MTPEEIRDVCQASRSPDRRLVSEHALKIVDERSLDEIMKTVRRLQDLEDVLTDQERYILSTFALTGFHASANVHQQTHNPPTPDASGRKF